MNEGLLGIAISVVGLFAWLLKYVMNENSKRETESAKREAGYQATIAKDLEVIQEQQGIIAKLAERYEDVHTAIEDLRKEITGK